MFSASNFRVADIHVSRLSRENAILLTRGFEERAKTVYARTYSSHMCLTAVIPAFAERDIHSLSGARRAVTDD
jgi:hypothetical protein